MDNLVPHLLMEWFLQAVVAVVKVLAVVVVVRALEQ
jgi:hypothetical protein